MAKTRLSTNPFPILVCLWVGLLACVAQAQLQVGAPN
jgi:hypothetical protein